jgi:hypothetical protein
MKPQNARIARSLMVFGLMALTVNASALEIGQLQLAGNGCVAPTGAHDVGRIDGASDRYSIPIMLKEEKLSEASLARVSCVMALPISLAANEKLQILDVSQKVRLRAGASSSARFDLEVFLVGQEGTKLNAEINAQEKTVRSTRTLNEEGVLAESKCGDSVMVRANSSARLMGTSRVRVQSEALKLGLRIVACN